MLQSIYLDLHASCCWPCRAVCQSLLATVRVERLPIKGGLKPEGICFDAAGDLWLVSEEDRMLRRLKV